MAANPHDTGTYLCPIWVLAPTKLGQVHLGLPQFRLYVVRDMPVGVEERLAFTPVTIFRDKSSRLRFIVPRVHVGQPGLLVVHRASVREAVHERARARCLAVSFVRVALHDVVRAVHDVRYAAAHVLPVPVRVVVGPFARDDAAVRLQHVFLFK